MSTRLGTVLFAASLSLGALGACGNRSSSKPSVTDPGTDPAAGTATSAPEGTPMNEIQTQLAAKFRVAPEDVKVRPLDGPAVPGLMAFTASINPKKLGRNASTSGVLAGKKILVEQEAMSAVARAWGYGAKRTVSAVDVAMVFAPLHSANQGVTAFFDADTLAAYKATAFPEQAAAAILPTEVEVEGRPAVKYCITSSGAIPLTVVTAIFQADGSVVLRTQPIGTDGGGGRD